MQLKRCNKCFQEKSIEEFSWRIKARNRRQSYCKSCCTQLRMVIYYRDPKAHKQKNNARDEKHYHYVYSFLADSRGCVDCGEKDIVCLDFDHIDPETKEHSISIMLQNGYAIEAIKREIEKCEIRCANCHRRKTAKDGNWWRREFSELTQRPECLSYKEEAQSSNL